jgi:2-amino-4-hydroxy-6-hydroxymethyldihydropteridine diphosphokinase
MINVYLLLGSNLGDRQMFLRRAAEYIEAQAGPVIQYSAVYETQSWGKSDAPDYLNQVLLIKTELPPKELLHTILAIELLLGREREEQWGARTVDIDILFYDDQIINAPDLIIPHPQLHNRRFTLEPLVEISPELLHPVLRKTVTQLKSELKDKLQVKKYIFE